RAHAHPGLLVLHGGAHRGEPAFRSARAWLSAQRAWPHRSRVHRVVRVGSADAAHLLAQLAPHAGTRPPIHSYAAARRGWLWHRDRRRRGERAGAFGTAAAAAAPWRRRAWSGWTRVLSTLVPQLLHYLSRHSRRRSRAGAVTPCARGATGIRARRGTAPRTAGRSSARCPADAARSALSLQHAARRLLARRARSARRATHDLAIERAAAPFH